MHKIKPLDNYLNEDFYNPFEEDDKIKSNSKSTHISDKSEPLKLRKEIFNINRVEYSKRAGGGYTVLAKTQFARGEIVEICPIIFVGAEVKAVKILKDYVFEIDKEKNIFGLVLGYGSLYKHNNAPNVDFAYNRSNRQMYFMSNRTINIGEELTINYGADYWAERSNLNLFTNDTSSNIIQPTTTEVASESQVQKTIVGMQDDTQAKINGSPISKSNPAVSGIPILSQGQS
jgi:uncharacterized protein